MKRRKVRESFRFANLDPFFVHSTPEGASILQEKVQSYRLLRYSERKRKTPQFAANVRVRSLVEPGTVVRRSAGLHFYIAGATPIGIQVERNNHS
jgi:hypothetical protein